MPFEPGNTLGQYEILSSLGAGGMGEVYLARDTELGRQVAIKLLLHEVSSNPERVARFKREARVLASLNHPNVATLYGFEREHDTHFLVMEFVDGDTLADVIARGPIAIEQAIPIFLQIAAGLEAAHESGVVHRDLKPANIKLSLDSSTDSSSPFSGRVKVLDFGLAVEADSAGAPAPEGSLTISRGLTQEGTVLGTAAYMSPEQARGRPIDKKTDVWAFGVCLYEALVGRRPFVGTDGPLLLSAILTAEPELDALPPETPLRLRRLLHRCLQKETRERLHDIADARLELAEIVGLDPDAEDSAPRPVRHPRLTQALAAVALLTTALALWGMLGRGPSDDAPRPVRRFEVDIGKALTMYDWSIVSQIALSPDGTRLVYAARFGEHSRLFVRRLDEVEATPIADTEHALSPFFSPDGQWVAFYSADSVGGVNQLKKVPLDGGPPQVLCDAWPPAGGTWLPDGTIVFSSTEPFVDRSVWDGSVQWGLFQVSDNGGTPRLLKALDRAAGGEAALGGPHALPGGRAVLFNLRRTGGDWAQPDSAADEPDWSSTTDDVAVLDVKSGEQRILITNAHDATYSDSGHILFVRDQALWAAPFDLDELAVAGSARIVRERLQSMRFPQTNAPYAIDAGGSAVFLPAAEVPERGRVLVWVDRGGGRVRADVPPGRQIETPRVSPDGERILYVDQLGAADVWVHERSRPGSRMRLTFDDSDARRPVWFPDSQWFLFVDRIEDDTYSTRYIFKTLRHRADGAGRPEPWPRSLTEISPLSIPMVVLPDGRGVLYQEAPDPRTHWDIADSTRPFRERYVVRSPAREEDPVLSLDGRWLAYSALESGVRQIYVRPFPDTQSARWQVTTDGGNQPLWAPDGSELYYRNGAAMMAVPIRTDPVFRASLPVQLFEGEFINPDDARRDYDLEYPEGRRFLMVEEFEPEVANTKLVFVENWVEELRRLVPVD